MTAQTCSVCGKRLTAWNTAWGTGKCSGCAKGVSPAAKALLRNMTFTRDELTAIAVARKYVLIAFAVLVVYWHLCGLSLAYAQYRHWPEYLFFDPMYLVKYANYPYPTSPWIIRLVYLFFAFFGFQAMTIYVLAKKLKRPNPSNWAALVVAPVLIPAVVPVPFASYWAVGVVAPVLILILKARAALKRPDASKPTGETNATIQKNR
jgi:hypothetical protein